MTWLPFEFWWHDFLSFLIGTLIVFVLIITLFCVFTLTSWPFTCCIYVTLCNCIVPYIALLFFRFKINIVFKIQGRTCYKPAFPCLVKPDAITSLSVHLLIDATRIMECLLCVGTVPVDKTGKHLCLLEISSHATNSGFLLQSHIFLIHSKGSLWLHWTHQDTPG